MNGDLSAGIAVVDLTPPAGIAMSGFAARTAPAVGVHDPLSARAVALTDGRGASLIVVADLVALTVSQAGRLRTAIAEETSLERSAVTVAVTHTHGGPHVTPDGLGSGADPAYVATAEAAIVNAAVIAWRDRAPASLRSARGSESSVSRNRRAPGGVTDPTVAVVRIDDPSGTPRAVLFSYACHPVVLGADNLLFTADWPGEARLAVERAFPGAVAIFAQGCCGQINCGHSAHDSMRLGADPGRTFAASQRIGRLVGRAAVEAARRAAPVDGPIRSAAVEVDLPFSPLSADELAAARIAWNRELDQGPEPARRLVLEAKRRWADEMAGRGSGYLTVDAAAHRWGEVPIVVLPGEPFVGFALDIRAALRRPDAVVLGYGNGVPGYLPYPPAEYDAGGYEVDEAHCFYGQLNCFAPECGPALVAAAVSASARLSG
jgi:hypothetical protein